MLVDRSTVSNFNDTNDQFVIDNLVQNAEVFLPDSVFLSILDSLFFVAFYYRSSSYVYAPQLGL